jgi:hypothetical protein
MIVGAHSILYSKDADRDRAFLRDVLGLPSVDVGGGWLIFGLPPAEVAVHPGEHNDVHEFYLMTDDLGALRRSLEQRGVTCSAPHTMSWGVLTQVTLPGGGKLGVYQPRHARPKPMRAGSARKRASGTRARSARSLASGGRPRKTGVGRKRQGRRPRR